MQNLEIQQYANKVILMLPDTVKRRLILPYIVGMSIGNFLAVKQGNELSPVTAFADMHAANVTRAVSRINEDMLIDVQAALDAAKMQYMIRHRIVNGECLDFQANPEFDFMAVAMGLATVMPVEVYNTMKETGLGTSRVFQLTNLLIAKLKADSIILS